MAEEKGLEVDIDGFNKAMQEQKDKGRSNCGIGSSWDGNETFEFENAEAAAVLQEESVPTVMNMLFEELPKLEVLDGPAVKAAFKAIQKATKLGGKAVFMPIRVALTGNQHGPELAEMVPLLGLERTEARIRASLAKAGITL